jgi:hypothetical protein
MTSLTICESQWGFKLAMTGSAIVRLGVHKPDVRQVVLGDAENRIDHAHVMEMTLFDE